MNQAIELVLDLRQLRDAPSTPEEFRALWAELEPALHGRDLRQGPTHQLDSPDGEIRLEVVWIPADVERIDESTPISVVAVRERPRVQYRCKHCGAYAPFTCSACPAEAKNNRVCDRHVVILDGALTPVCREHRPACEQCDDPAEFRCAGRACRREKGWCARHRRPHPRDPDIDYCPSCYDAAFPHCETPGCQDIGTVRCEHVSQSFQHCPQRMCTRHATRWQVFGSERVGLGLCANHSRVRGGAPADLVFEIITGAAGRRRPERLPSLQGFAHTLRNCGHRDLAIDYAGIHRLLQATEPEVRGNRAAAQAFDRSKAGWAAAAAAVATTAHEGERLMEKLRELVIAANPRSGTEVAAAIELAEYKPSRNTRPAMLFVKVPEHLRGRFIGSGGQGIRFYTAQLGMKVQIEGGRR
ncbi:hypothetical protein [Nocardia nova]